LRSPAVEAAACISAVRSRGLARALGTPLGKLGVDSTDMKRLSASVLEQHVASAVGPVLIAPLRDPARAADLRSLTAELSKYSTRARRHPIERRRGQRARRRGALNHTRAR